MRAGSKAAAKKRNRKLAAVAGAVVVAGALAGVAKKVAGAAKKATRRRAAASRGAAATAKKASAPAKAAASKRRVAPPATPRPVQRRSDVAPSEIDTMTPSQMSGKGPFDKHRGEHLHEEEARTSVANTNEQFSEEDRYTNRTGDPRIGTHNRDYE